MFDVTQVHEDVFSELMKWKNNEDPEMRFTFRRSNHAARMEEGYWFYGNENYLAVSFWTGMDWKNRTPNICFIISSDGEAYLEVNVSDSEKKRNFVSTYLVKQLNLQENGRKYYKHYDFPDKGPIELLERFLRNDKKHIDLIIHDHSKRFFNDVQGDDAINFITQEDFNQRLKKINKYRQLRVRLQSEDSSFQEERPSKIMSVRINNYGRLKKVKIDILDKNNQWVFITGENGSGKTKLLRALGTIFGNRVLDRKELVSDKNFNATIQLYKNNKSFIQERSVNDIAKSKKRPLVQGLAMYGPYRLEVTEKRTYRSFLSNALTKEGSFKSLFKNGEPLLNIDKQFEIWQKGSKKEKERFENRMYYFRSVLTDIVPNLVDVRFKAHNKIYTEYVFKDEGDDRTFCYGWNELPSGIKSTIAMLGDIMIRMYDQQRNIDDPSELKGVVLIDEIDLHLHPKAQKDIVVNLSKTFPQIQFFVTTHSPIPLLGANSNSVFFLAKRKYTEFSLNRLEFIEQHIKELLPNQLLTSDLFGLNSLTSIQTKDYATVFSGSTMTDVVQYLELKKENIIRDVDNSTFIEKLKSKWREEGE